MALKALCAALLLAGVIANDAAAHDYPNRPITVIVPFAAGGPADLLGRLLGTTMSGTLKQQIIVDNVGGAGGTIGTGRAAKSLPDGYTLLLMHVGIATAPALYRRLPYDATNDLEGGPLGEGAHCGGSCVTMAADSNAILSHGERNGEEGNAEPSVDEGRGAHVQDAHA
jgi:Tripartite tricarboxylate transporter family receptor